MTIDGPEHRLLIKNEEDFKAPTKAEDPFAWELIRTTLKNAGKLEDVSTVNSAMLKFAVKKKKMARGFGEIDHGTGQTGREKIDFVGKKMKKVPRTYYL